MSYEFIFLVLKVTFIENFILCKRFSANVNVSLHDVAVI